MKYEKLLVACGLNILVSLTASMLYQNTIRSLEEYAKKCPEDKILDLLSIAESNNKIIKRENLSGHITASGLVLLDNNLLLIFHKKLQRYLQPGGHLENDETLVQAAQREVLEETGIYTTPYKSEKSDFIIPIHIDIHLIPFNEKKASQSTFTMTACFYYLLKI